MTADRRASGCLRQRAGWSRAWRGHKTGSGLDRPHLSCIHHSHGSRVWSVDCPAPTIGDPPPAPAPARLLWLSGSELQKTPVISVGWLLDSASVPLSVCCNLYLPRSASRPPSPTRNSSLSRPDLDIECTQPVSDNLLWAYKDL